MEKYPPKYGDGELYPAAASRCLVSFWHRGHQTVSLKNGALSGAETTPFFSSIALMEEAAA
jgi:hypothetical protein